MSPKLIVDFEFPPLVEVAIGIQFEGVKLNSIQNAKLFEEFQSEYPVYQEVPVKHHQIEDFSGRTMMPSFQFSQQTSAPDLGLWLTSKDKENLLQIQSNSFFRNWRRQEGGTYPHYPKTGTDFLNDFEKFRNVVGGVDLQQLEMSYINHIPNPAESYKGIDLPNDTEDFHLAYRRRLNFGQEHPTGRLYTSITPAFQREGLKQISILQLTVRTLVESGLSRDKLTEKLDFSRKSIVEEFLNLTTQIAKETWGIKQ